MPESVKNLTLDVLRDEYKILQDKIDKIGAFKFTIRGWSVTLVLGGFLAGSGGKLLPARLISLCVCVALWFFLTFEREQVLLSNKCGGRAKLVEGLIQNELGELGSCPAITHLFSNRRYSEVRWYTRLISKSIRRQLLRTTNWLRVWRQANAAFYIILMFLSCLPAFTPSSACKILAESSFYKLVGKGW